MKPLAPLSPRLLEVIDGGGDADAEHEQAEEAGEVGGLARGRAARRAGTAERGVPRGDRGSVDTALEEKARRT